MPEPDPPTRPPAAQVEDRLAPLIEESRRHLDDHFAPIREVRAAFDAGCAALDPPVTARAKGDAWSAVIRPSERPMLLAVQPVARSSGVGQVSLYQGDAFALPAEQWVCSAFQDEVSPTGGAWRSFWHTAARHGSSWTDRACERPCWLDPDGQTATLPTNPRHRDGLPTVVLFGRGSRRERKSRDPLDWPERVYFDGLQAARRLAREGRLGTRLAMPVLFGELHGVPYDDAIRLQRAFALDLVRQQAGVQEVMISVVGVSDADRLLAAWHLAAGDRLATPRSAFPAWVTDTLDTLQAELRGALTGDLDDDLCAAIRDVLRRMDAEPLYLNDIAVLARNVVERWAIGHCHRAGMTPTTDLASMVGQLRGRAGTPHRTLLYVDAIRELGNVGAHFQKAPHPLEPADLVTLLLGLRGVIRLERELWG